MLELAESATVARQINDAIKGLRIVSAVADASPRGFVFYHGDPAGYPALLEGRRLLDARALGGMVELTLEGGARLLFGDGASPRYHAAGEPLPKKHQLLLGLEDGGALSCTVQMYGGIWAYPAGRGKDDLYYRAALEKPSPLTDAFTPACFDRLWDGVKPSLSAKALLATEQRVPGLGNGSLQDILFLAGVHPKSKAAALTDARRERLYVSVRDTLREMAARGGRDTERDLFGRQGGYRTLLSKNTLQSPCPRCGGPLARQTFLGGNVYFCPHCQPI